MQASMWLPVIGDTWRWALELELLKQVGHRIGFITQSPPPKGGLFGRPGSGKETFRAVDSPGEQAHKKNIVNSTATASVQIGICTQIPCLQPC